LKWLPVIKSLYEADRQTIHRTRREPLNPGVLVGLDTLFGMFKSLHRVLQKPARRQKLLAPLHFKDSTGSHQNT
jgi:hypothetical protein